MRDNGEYYLRAERYSRYSKDSREKRSSAKASARSTITRSRGAFSEAPAILIISFEGSRSRYRSRAAAWNRAGYVRLSSAEGPSRACPRENCLRFRRRAKRHPRRGASRSGYGRRDNASDDVATQPADGRSLPVKPTTRRTQPGCRWQRCSGRALPCWVHPAWTPRRLTIIRVCTNRSRSSNSSSTSRCSNTPPTCT